VPLAVQVTAVAWHPAQEGQIAFSTAEGQVPHTFALTHWG
jgi:hypothetical protein